MKFDPNINPNQVAAQVAMLSFIATGAATARSALNDDAQASMRPADRVSAMVAGQFFGRLNVPSDSTLVEVTDGPALLAWAEKHRPDMVHTVQQRTFHTMSLHWLLEDAKAKGAAVDPDGVAIPGITVTLGGNAPRMVLEDNVRHLVADALADPETRPYMVEALRDAVAAVLNLDVDITIRTPELEGVPDEPDGRGPQPDVPGQAAGLPDQGAAGPGSGRG